MFHNSSTCNVQCGMSGLMLERCLPIHCNLRCYSKRVGVEGKTRWGPVKEEDLFNLLL